MRVSGCLVKYYREYVGTNGTVARVVREDFLEEPEYARIIEGCVYYYKTASIHPVYKAYRLMEGEFVEIQYEGGIV